MAYSSSSSLKLNHPVASVRSFQSSLTWLVFFAGLLCFSALLSIIMIKIGPRESLPIWVLYFLGVAAILYRPRAGLYLVICLGLAGDGVLTPWFPFVKNFSSRESLLFLNDALIINPLETYLALTFLSWLIRAAAQRKLKIYSGALIPPALLFLLFVFFGLFYGLYTGGNLNIALWEARPMFYMVGMLILVSNLIEKRAHVLTILWAAMIGIFLEGLSGTYFFFFKLQGNLAGVNAITDHPASVHMNSLIVFFLGSLLYKTSPAKRITLAAMLPVVLLTYIATQRRAAFVTLGAALILIAILLYVENRKAFWLIVPVAAALISVYLVIFWNQNGALGLPAQAVKSVIAPSQASAVDQASNAYRDIENINLNFTIHQKPFTGVGFGQKFYVIIPLPDISFFQWWQYFPHNSIIWIWLKTGATGFFSMLFLVGSSIMTGSRALWRTPRNELSAAALTAVLYLVMHLIFAYVDIGWDSQSMLYVGMMMGILNRLEYVVAQPVALSAKRWHWQRDPKPPLGLLPLPDASANGKIDSRSGKLPVVASRSMIRGFRGQSGI